MFSSKRSLFARIKSRPAVSQRKLPRFGSIGIARLFSNDSLRRSVPIISGIILVIIGVAFLPGCSKDGPVVADIETRIEDIPGFDFKLPCPVAGFSPEYLFTTSVPRDGIRPVDRPTFSAASKATWLTLEDRVLGVVFEGQALAIPIRIMVWHEVVNIAGTSERIAVTYCPLTFTGIAFDLEKAFPGQSQTVGVSGLLYNSNLVLYDRKTDSFWPQMSGSAYGGPSAGICLDLLPVMDTTLLFWLTLYPDTKVLDRPGKSESWFKYNINIYETYWAIEDVVYPVPRPLDNRLKSKDWVLGVLADTGEKSFPLLSVPVVNDSLPGVPFVVFNKGRDKTLVAYQAWVVDGERLNFSAFKDNPDGTPTYTDDRTGSRWNFKGECMEGPLAGSVLERMPSYLSFYFAWWSYFPETSVYAAP